jgi:glycosyltransferase involved in cell wall biosynthesis
VKILYVSHYFPPEMGAPAGRVAGLARLWARAGHEVHVLTGFPHHPVGKVHPEYRAAFRRGYLREELDGVHVHRTWIFPAANRGKLLRSLNYFSFMLSALVTGCLRLPRPDVIVATSPQLLCAAAGALLARRYAAPLVMEVRDLWPESLVAVGASTGRSPLVRALEGLARWLYRAAAHVVTVTEAQRAAIVATGISEGAVSVIPNGVDEEFIRRTQAMPQSDARAGNFVATYIGTLGMAHRLETLLEAAAQMRADRGVEFRLVGEGAARAALEAKARDMGLRNVQFVGERPRQEVPAWIAASDVCLVLLRRTEVFLTVVPSKMLEIMAAGRPMILGVEGEARELLERASAGIAITPENAAQLVEALRRLRADRSLRRQLGENGRQFVQREFRRDALAARYLALLQTLACAHVAAPDSPPCTETEATEAP